MQQNPWRSTPMKGIHGNRCPVLYIGRRKVFPINARLHCAIVGHPLVLAHHDSAAGCTPPHIVQKRRVRPAGLSRLGGNVHIKESSGAFPVLPRIISWNVKILISNTSSLRISWGRNCSDRPHIPVVDRPQQDLGGQSPSEAYSSDHRLRI